MADGERTGGTGCVEGKEEVWEAMVEEDAEAEEEIEAKAHREPDRKKRKSADDNPIPRCELCKQRKVRLRYS